MYTLAKAALIVALLQIFSLYRAVEIDDIFGDRRSMTEEEKQQFEKLRNKKVESLSSEKYLEMLKKDRNICNPLVRQSFGMTGGEKFITPRDTTWRDRAYCPLASRTCCDHRSIAKVIKFYQEARKKFRDSWSIVLETLALLRGIKFRQFLIYHQKHIRENCMYIFNDPTLKRMGKNEIDFFHPEKLQHHLYVAEQLSNDLKSYINNNEFFYGGLICTICNPNANRYFWMNKDHPVFKVSMSMCAKFVEMELQEVMVAKLYNNFLLPLGKVINCISDRETDPDYTLPEVDRKYFKTQKKVAESCSRDFDPENPDCREICKPNYFTYEFPSNLLEVYKVALKVIFEGFTHMDISNYYKEIKHQDFDSVIIDKIDFLNPNTKEAVAVNMKDAEIDLKVKGMNVFYNHIALRSIRILKIWIFGLLALTLFAI